MGFSTISRENCSAEEGATKRARRSLRCARSPPPPKMTRVTESRAMGAVAPADNRSNSEPLGALAPESGIALLDGVAAELVAQRCQQAVRKWVGLTRPEPGE